MYHTNLYCKDVEVQ